MAHNGGVEGETTQPGHRPHERQSPDGRRKSHRTAVLMTDLCPLLPFVTTVRSTVIKEYIIILDG